MHAPRFSPRGTATNATALVVLIVLAALPLPARAGAQATRWRVLDTMSDTSVDGRIVGTLRVAVRSASTVERRRFAAAVPSRATSHSEGDQPIVMRATYASATPGDSVVVEGTLALSCARSTARVLEARVLQAPTGIVLVENPDTVTVDRSLVRKACAARRR
jgi:hypothetical protein